MLHDLVISRPSGTRPTPDDEAELVLRAVRATKLPTLTYEDLAAFKDLMRDMWPTISVADVEDASLVEALETALKARQLLIVPEQVRC